MASSPSSVQTTGDASKPTVPVGQAASRYASGRTDRDPFLTRARRCASLTIPSLFRAEGDNGSTDQEVPWNSAGAYMVSNLAAKVILALFPAGRPPMKLKQDRKSAMDLMKLPEDERGKLKADIDKGLSMVEQEFVEAMDEDGDRARLNIAALKLIVGGNHGIQLYPDGTIRGVSLDRFCTWRDPSGNLLEFVIADPLAWETLPEDIKAACKERGYQEAAPGSKAEITVYTHGLLSGGKWTVYQEVCGFEVAASRASYVPEALPFLFLPWILLDGENYGRSYVELYEGDLQTVEGNTQTVAEGSAALAMFLRFVHPGGLTSKKAVAEARNGDVLTGRAEDVTTLQGNKGADFQSALSITQDAANRLSRAFLLNSAVQRGGERVTAEEIRFVAQELEDALGGVYSQQVVTWQTPYVRLKMRYLQRTGRVTPLPQSTVKVTIIAGMAALGRNAELQALDSFIGGSAQVIGPEAVQQAVNPRVYMTRRAAALGISTEGLVYSEEDAAQRMQAQMQQQLLQQAAPEALRQLGTNITSNQVAETNAQSKVDAAVAKGAEGAPAEPQPSIQ